MHILCPISGEDFFSSMDFKNEPAITTPHPIFSLPPRSLLAKAKKYGNQRYTEKEEKLLFLALLNSTEAVEWEVPGSPTPQVVSKNLDTLFKLVAWFQEVKGYSLTLPKMRVSLLNNSLENINIFISAWYEIRQEWMSQSSRKLLADVIEHREQLLDKLIHSPRSTEQYAKKLISWALIAANVPKDRWEEWTHIFCLKLNEEALTADLDELLDMRDLFERELYKKGVGVHSGGGSLYSHKTLEHLQKLVKIKEGGLLGLLGAEVGGPGNTFSFLTHTNIAPEKEESRKKELVEFIATKNAPASEPLKKEYEGRISDWIRAKAAWVLVKAAKEELFQLERNSL